MNGGANSTVKGLDVGATEEVRLAGGMMGFTQRRRRVGQLQRRTSCSIRNRSRSDS